MILPGKHLKEHRALIGVGGTILAKLTEDSTVSELWQALQNEEVQNSKKLSFDWFIAALTFLFTIGAIQLDRGILSRRNRP